MTPVSTSDPFMKTHMPCVFRDLRKQTWLRPNVTLLILFIAQWTTRAQVPATDNFNTGLDAGWAHYAPLQTAPWNEQVSWTFPADPAGGRYYRIFGGVPNISYDPATAN